MSEQQQNTKDEYKKQKDGDSFNTWNIAGLDQCGSDRYMQNQNMNSYSDSFRVLYEKKKHDESDEFRRIYVPNSEDLNSPLQSDNEFKPFKTGIARFDQRMSGKSAPIDVNNQENTFHAKTFADSSGITSNLSETASNLVDTNSKLSGSNSNLSDTNSNLSDTNSDLSGSNFNLSETTTNLSGINSNTLTPTLAAERKRVFEEAYKEGFEQGQSNGFQLGKAKGYEEGFAKGIDDGLTQGIEEGHKTGQAKGEQEGYEAGFQKGEEDGRLISDTKALEIITSLEDILQKTDSGWQNFVKTHEPKMLSLICKIAEKVVFAKVDLDEDIVKESILNALYTMPEPEEITLNISPDDYEYVEMIKEDFFQKIKSLKSISVISNPSITRGGCRIESSKGKVETNIQARLDKVVSSIMGARLS